MYQHQDRGQDVLNKVMKFHVPSSVSYRKYFTNRNVYNAPEEFLGVCPTIQRRRVNRLCHEVSKTFQKLIWEEVTSAAVSNFEG